MIHYKNKALDDLYNYRPKQPTKNFKTKDAQDYAPRPELPPDIIPKPAPRVIPETQPSQNIIPKPTPRTIPEAPQKHLEPTTNKYMAPDNFNSYVKIGPDYPRSVEPPAKPSEPHAKLPQKVDRPGKPGPYYRGFPKDEDHEPTLAEKALKGPSITDEEGLNRATSSDNSVYIYGDTLYIAGTKGGIMGREWGQNMEYIAKPIVKGLFQNNLDKIQAFGTFLAPELAPEIALAKGALELGKSQQGKGAADETRVRIDLTDRYKQAIQAMEANPQIKKVVGFSVGGMTALELKKKYQDLTGSVYGTPAYDPFAKELIKDHLNETRKGIDYRYDNSLLGRAGKYYDNKVQDAVEMALGLNDVKTMKDTGINRYRQAGDLLTSLDNSAITSIDTSNLLNPIKAHNYSQQASAISTVDPSNAYGRVNPDNSISMIQ